MVKLMILRLCFLLFSTGDMSDEVGHSECRAEDHLAKEAFEQSALNLSLMQFQVNSLAANSCARLGCGPYNSEWPCQCSAGCYKYGNCCSDYNAICNKAPVYTFYLYRAQNQHNYPPENTNLGTLGGVLWYVHNEVVGRCHGGHRKFQITRIVRYKVTVRATAALHSAGMNFAVRVAFDKGQCTGAFHSRSVCGHVWRKYGFVVGCNILGQGPYPTCPPYGPHTAERYCPINYPGAAWYSLPGKCPDRRYDQQSASCEADAPGGFCKGSPTGAPDCTWTYTYAGDIDLDKLSGITKQFGSHWEFCRKGCIEYVKYGNRDRGHCVNFWNWKRSRVANQWRMDKLDKAFKAEYPDMPSDAELPPPVCDFNKGAFYKDLYR
mmetsp:Transcript_786/g.1931  ORF Transcript_786/g.1931 Transcript_786/m.1931 type:complete len:378 (+) Transcript_786:59-1192(+)